MNQKTSLFQWWLSHPYLLLGVIGTLTVFFGYHAAGVEIDFHLERLFESNHKSFRKYRRFVEEFQSETERSVIVAFHHRDGIFRDEIVRKIQKLKQKIEEIPETRRVVSYTDFLTWIPPGKNGTRRRLLTSLPFFRHTFVSPDASTGSLLIQTDFRKEHHEGPRFFRQLRIILEPLQDHPSIEVYKSGVPVVNNEYARLIRKDNRTYFPVAAVSLVLILIGLFRHWKGVVFPILTVLIGMIWTIGFLVLSGGVLGLMNSVVPTLILCIGIADSIHILCRYQNEKPGREGLIKTLRSMSLACFLTSFTTAIGFGTLIVTTVYMVRNFGGLMAVGLLLTYLISMVVIFSLFSLFPDFPSFCSKGGKQDDHQDLPHEEADREPPRQKHLGHLLERWSRYYLRYPRVIMALFAVFVGVSLIGLVRIQMKSSWFQDLKKKNTVRRDNRWIEEHLGGVFTVEAVLTAEGKRTFEHPERIQKLQSFQQSLNHVQPVSHTRSISDLVQTVHGMVNRSTNPGFPSENESVKSTFRKLNALTPNRSITQQYLSDDRKKARVTFYLNSPNSREVRKFMKKARSEVPNSMDLMITGLSIAADEALSNVLRDMFFSVGLAVLFLFLVMTYRFGSFRLGMLSMVPNIIPIFTTFAVMGWLGISLNFSTVTIFSISLGIAVDDTIHFLHGLREMQNKHDDLREAVFSTIRVVGRPLVFTTCALVFGFGSILTSNFQFTFHFGILGMATIFSALLADLFILPALILVFGWE